jgi:hypothetical protein
MFLRKTSEPEFVVIDRVNSDACLDWGQLKLVADGMLSPE